MIRNLCRCAKEEICFFFLFGIIQWFPPDREVAGKCFGAGQMISTIFDWIWRKKNKMILVIFCNLAGKFRLACTWQENWCVGPGARSTVSTIKIEGICSAVSALNYGICYTIFVLDLTEWASGDDAFGLHAHTHTLSLVFPLAKINQCV